MQHQDAQVANITVVLRKECAEKLEETIATLKKLDMQVGETDADNGVVAGTVMSDKLPHIKSCPCVEYVRVDFTYIADYPLGDPRNQDAADEDAESED